MKNKVYGIKNTTLDVLVTDGHRKPLVFGSEEDVARWFRLNGYPKSLVIVNSKAGLSVKERKELIKTWNIKNGR